MLSVSRWLALGPLGLLDGLVRRTRSSWLGLGFGPNPNPNRNFNPNPNLNPNLTQGLSLGLSLCLSLTLTEDRSPQSSITQGAMMGLWRYREI